MQDATTTHPGHPADAQKQQETNRDAGYEMVSKALAPSARYRQFLDLDYHRKALTVEPLMDFNLDVFANTLCSIRPEFVWFGLNSHAKPARLPEPPAEKVYELARRLIARGIPVKGKELRGMHMPAGVIRHQD